MPPLPSRTLRCANGALYMLMALATTAAAVYAALSGKLTGLPMLLSAAGALIILLWAGYYATLSYRVGPEGISRSVFWRTRTRCWQDLLKAELYEHEAQGVATCRIRLSFASGVWCISSELFVPESVQELKSDLIAAGLLCKA